MDDASIRRLPHELMAIDGPDVDLAMAALRPYFEVFAQQVAEIGKALEPNEVDEFSAGYRRIMHEFVDAAFVPESDPTQVGSLIHEFLTYLQSWSLTCRLSSNADWLAQMSETRGEVKVDPVTFEELAARVVR